ncbi:hypothetical protein D9M73_124650 [compost metagenome]
MEHLLHRHTHDDAACLIGIELGVADRLAALIVPDERVISIKIDRDRREFDLDRRLQVGL